MAQLDEKAIRKISGPAWSGLRPLVLAASERLLAAADGGTSELTTVYVKFSASTRPGAEVYAVVWIKTSKQLTIGLALPAGIYHDPLQDAPPGFRYKGLTKYLILHPGDELPAAFDIWAKQAYANAIAGTAE
jgi:hypothetical protein